ncbi:MAG: site-specific integrase [bacterium]
MESQRKNKQKFHPNSDSKLMDQVREVLRYHHYAYRTEQTYRQWILRYIYHFCGKTHPKRLGAKDVERFLSHLATRIRCLPQPGGRPSTHWFFLYRDVLDKPLVTKIASVCHKRKQRPSTIPYLK